MNVGKKRFGQLERVGEMNKVWIETNNLSAKPWAEEGATPAAAAASASASAPSPSAPHHERAFRPHRGGGSGGGGRRHGGGSSPAKAAPAASSSSSASP